MGQKVSMVEAPATPKEPLKTEEKPKKQPQTASAEYSKITEEAKKLSRRPTISTTSETEIEDKLRTWYKYDIIKAAAEKPKVNSLFEDITEGIYYSNYRRKFWVDAEGCHCFMLFAKALQIIWSEDELFWTWLTDPDEMDDRIKLARLRDVCWLHIHGTLDISYLTKETTYEVMFKVKKEPGYGLDEPVNLRLKLPPDMTQQTTVKIMPETDGWLELKAGEIRVPYTDSEKKEMEFTLYEHEGKNWKRGLLVKGVIIRPKSSSSSSA